MLPMDFSQFFLSDNGFLYFSEDFLEDLNSDDVSNLSLFKFMVYVFSAVEKVVDSWIEAQGHSTDKSAFMQELSKYQTPKSFMHALFGGLFNWSMIDEKSALIAYLLDDLNWTKPFGKTLALKFPQLVNA